MKWVWLVAIPLAMAIEVPLGLDRHVPTPEGKPLRREEVELGRRLFADARLSRDGTISCASCHEATRAFSDGKAVAEGVAGRRGLRRTPRISNRAWGKSFFWDGRARSLEEQVLGPIGNPREMDLEPGEAARRVGLRREELQDALASYVRTIFSGNSAYDRYLAGETEAMNAAQKRGLQLFRGKAGCTSCHMGPLLSDEEFHVTGASGGGRASVDSDAGRGAVSQREEERGAFKTPSLRDVARTPPYMHDGSFATLRDVLRFYNEGGRARANLDVEMRRLDLSEKELEDLEAFLGALNGRIVDGWR